MPVRIKTLCIDDHPWTINVDRHLNRYKAGWGRKPSSDRLYQIQIRFTRLMLTAPALVSLSAERLNIHRQCPDHVKA